MKNFTYFFLMKYIQVGDYTSFIQKYVFNKLKMKKIEILKKNFSNEYT